MKILSLFDGLSCGSIAFKKLNIEPEEYVAYEIDKNAIKSTEFNFPNVKQNGDVFDADFTQYQDFKYIIGGSPCTYWSICQTNHRENKAEGLGWDLFCQYKRALLEAKPKYFIYENNDSMSQDIRNCINEEFGFEGTTFNSNTKSAQNRKRIFWVGRLNKHGVYEKVDVPFPCDEGIILKDIVNTSINTNGYYLSEEYFKGGFNSTLIGMTKNGEGKYRNGGQPSQQYRIYSCNDKSQVVNTLGNENYIIPVTNLIGMDDTVYKVTNGHIIINDKPYPINLEDGYYIVRKLILDELKQLQTIPDWYEFPVSDRQATKLIGNGWTVDIVCHIINYIENLDE